MFRHIPKFRKDIVCKDNFTISIQGSHGHCCSPREDAPEDGWSQLELGFPSDPEELILEYAEDKSNPCNTVYGWVPVEVVREVITKHGGLADSSSANLVRSDRAMRVTLLPHTK